MNPLIIVFVGMIVVVGGVLALRLHAFLALILGALVVALLTSTGKVYESEILTTAVVVESTDEATGTIDLRIGKRQSVFPGRQLVLRFDARTRKWQTIGEVVLGGEVGQSERRFIHSTTSTGIRLQPDDRLIHHTQHAGAVARSRENVGERIASGFGNTCGDIGILIAMAAIVGKCLLDSGAAERVVLAIRDTLGEKRTPIAFVVSGFTVAIPVFYDTVFYLLIPLGKALAARTKKNYLLYVLSIVVGATLAHSLVPPTPGPLLVANELGVDLGLMILGGIVIGAIGCVFGYFYARFANWFWDIPLRPSAELSKEQLEVMAQRDPRELPPFWVSILPIALPVVLLAGNTTLGMLSQNGRADWNPWLSGLYSVVAFLGNKNIALTVAAAIALITLVWWRKTSRQETLHRVQDALASGGIIILITAAGGAFGHVLRQTNIAAAIGEQFPVEHAGFTLLVMAFVVTSLVRVAQGSATVAMITSVSIVGPLAVAMELPFHALYLALAIGCGSKPLPWMNDSGFWITSKMSGMTEAETLKTYTVALSIMGIVCFAATLAGAMLLPLV